MGPERLRETFRVLGFSVLLAFLSSAAAVAQQAGAAGAEESAGPTLEDVLANHYEALGGLDAIKSLRSLRQVATMEIGGQSIPATTIRQRPRSQYSAIEPAGTLMENGFDGAVAWIREPNAPKAYEMEGSALVITRTLADFDGPLVDAPRKRIDLELVGKEELSGGSAHRIEATGRDGRQTLWIDTESGLLVRRSVETPDGTAVFELSDYRAVAGVQLPHREEMSGPAGNAVLVTSTYEANPTVEPHVFLMPGQVADASLGLEQILERHAKSRVGAGASDVKTLTVQGKVSLQGLTLPMTMAFERPDRFRVTIELSGMQTILAFDGEEAWTVSPLQGIMEPEALPPEAIDAVAVFSDFVWGFLVGGDAPETSFDGVSRVGRHETYRLVLTTDDGIERTVELGGEDFLEHRIVFRGVFLGNEGELDVRLEEYATTNGLTIPQALRLLSDGAELGSMSLTELEPNGAIEPGWFSREAALAAASEQP